MLKGGHDTRRGSQGLSEMQKELDPGVRRIGRGRRTDLAQERPQARQGEPHALPAAVPALRAHRAAARLFPSRSNRRALRYGRQHLRQHRRAHNRGRKHGAQQHRAGAPTARTPKAIGTHKAPSALDPLGAASLGVPSYHAMPDQRAGAPAMRARPELRLQQTLCKLVCVAHVPSAETPGHGCRCGIAVLRQKVKKSGEAVPALASA